MKPTLVIIWLLGLPPTTWYFIKLQLSAETHWEKDDAEYLFIFGMALAAALIWFLIIPIRFAARTIIRTMKQMDHK